MPVAGHLGQSKTLELLAWYYYWPKMYKEVDQFVRNCHTCQRAWTSRHAPFNVLQPMPIPDGTWCHISIDFIVGLQWSNSYNTILVVVCQLTKIWHFIPYQDMCTAEQLADLYAWNIFRLYSLPKTVVSDRGMQFIAKFWKGLYTILKIEALLSTPYHPETEGVGVPVHRGILLFFSFIFIFIFLVILLFMRKCGAKGTCFFLVGLCKQNYAGDVLRAEWVSRQGERGQHQHHGRRHYYQDHANGRTDRKARKKQIDAVSSNRHIHVHGTQ